MGYCLFMRKGETHTAPLALPSGYTKLAYIQSSGTQYINTGITPTNKTRVVCKISNYPKTSYSQAVFGSRTSVSASDRYVFMSAENTDSYRTDLYNNNATFETDVNFTDEFTIDKNGSITTLNSSISVSNTDGDFTSTLSIFLFAINTNGSASAQANGLKMLSCKIYKDGVTLDRDFIHCINASGEIGLYDLVGKKFYANAGTGTFTGSEVA